MYHEYSMLLNPVQLRPLSAEESEKMRILRNNNRKWFVYSNEIASDEQLIWYKNYLNKPDDYMFSALYIPTNTWIGAAGIYNVAHQQAEFGRLLVDKSATEIKGLGVYITRAVCKIGFEVLNLNRIQLEVYEDNLAAIKTYTRAGFTCYGRHQDECGRSMLLMEILSKNTQR